MDKKTRFLAAMDCRPVDRVPGFFYHHFPQDRNSGEKGIQSHIDMYKQVDNDAIKIMADAFSLNFKDEFAAIQKASDWRKIKSLGKNHTWIQQQVDLCKRINDALKHECCSFYTIFNPFTLVRANATVEKIDAHMAEDREAVLGAMKTLGEDLALIAELAVSEAGCTGIYYSVQNAVKGRYTVEEYKEMITPLDMIVLEHANKLSDYNILHCCAWYGDPNNLEVWQNYPAKAINWAVHVENMDLMQGKKFFGGRCVIGGFDNRPEALLQSGSEQEIKAFTRDLLDKTEKTGFIAGADCALNYELDPKHFAYVLEVLKDS